MGFEEGSLVEGEVERVSRWEGHLERWWMLE
jgi:hypothetical protein